MNKFTFFDENMVSIDVGKQEKAQNIDKFFTNRTEFNQVLVILKEKDKQIANADRSKLLIH